MKIDDLTIGEAKQLVAIFGETAKPATTAYKIGQSYFIRTLSYHYTGRCVRITPSELVLEEAAWIADSGRFADALESGELDEVEPYPAGELIINRSVIVDAWAWSHPLPRNQK